MPESISVCGELIAPPLSTTSPARTRLGVVLRPVVYSTPTAREPSNRILVTNARVRTSRFFRCITGCRYARAADSRLPSWMLRSNGAKPSWRNPFTSSVR